MTTSASASVAVLGAGPAGLAAAVGLARAGHHVVVLEAAGRVGGMSASIEVAGQRVDLGSHRLHPVATPEVEALLGEALGADLQRRRRRGRIRLEGRWLDFPLRPLDMVAHLPPTFALGAVRDVVTARWRSEPTSDNAHAALVARLGPTVAERFYRPYLTKLYGVDPTALHAEVADRRVAARRATDVVARVLAPRPDHDFRAPRGGFGRLSEGLARLAVTAGADLRLSTPVMGLRLEADQVIATVPDDELVVDVVVSTVPVGLVARLAAAPPRVRVAAGQLGHRGLHIVHVDLDTPRLSDVDAFYFPGPETTLARLSEPRNFRDDPDDPPDHTVVCAEVPFGPQDPVPSARDLEEQVVGTLRRTGLPVPRVRSTTVTSLPRVYPVYTRASLAALATVERWAETLPRVLSVGRQGLYTPDNTHHVLAMGLDVAGVVGPNGIDRDEWSLRRAAYHEFVVED